METRIGYSTPGRAEAAATVRCRNGLTGSGQQCGALELRDGSWGYWTAHSYYQPHTEPGHVLLPGGRELDPTTPEAEALLGEDWMMEEMFTPASWTLAAPSS